MSGAVRDERPEILYPDGSAKAELQNRMTLVVVGSVFAFMLVPTHWAVAITIALLVGWLASRWVLPVERFEFRGSVLTHQEGWREEKVDLHAVSDITIEWMLYADPLLYIRSGNVRLEISTSERTVAIRRRVGDVLSQTRVVPQLDPAVRKALFL